MVTIRGPKGVGKSMALGAIATMCHKQRPCFLWSPIANKDFQSYVEDIRIEFGKQFTMCQGSS